VILVDTSVWVGHLKAPDKHLITLLDQVAVVTHPWIVGELALGGLDAETLALLQQLPRAAVATDAEVLRMIRAELSGTGIGYVDAQLLAATRLTPDCRLWTRDGRLRRTAGHLAYHTTTR
jgi:predicted nucleic acid-binding protein